MSLPVRFSIRIGLTVSVIGLIGLGVGRPPLAHASTPTHQTVANLSDSGVTILWDTAGVESGSVAYGTSCGALNGTVDGGSSAGHVVDISGLSASTTYLYAITSGGTVLNNGGACFSFTTLPAVLPPPPVTAVGRVFTGSPCTTPVTSGIITVSESGPSGVSGKNEVVPNDAGSGAPGTYSLPFNPAAKTDSSGYFSSETNDTITVTADTGQAQQSATSQWNGTDSVVTMPDICVSVATAARVASFSAVRQKSTVLFRWRMGSTQGVAGFNVYAGRVQLNSRVIRPHASALYHYRAPWSGRKSYTLHVLLSDGTELMVPWHV
jgi:hypothetical protein